MCETIGTLQDQLSSSNPQLEKRSDDIPEAVFEDMSRLMPPEPSLPVHRTRFLVASDIPRISSFLLYTQTTSTFL